MASRTAAEVARVSAPWHWLSIGWCTDAHSQQGCCPADYEHSALCVDSFPLPDFVSPDKESGIYSA